MNTFTESLPLSKCMTSSPDQLTDLWARCGRKNLSVGLLHEVGELASGHRLRRHARLAVLLLVVGRPARRRHRHAVAVPVPARWKSISIKLPNSTKFGLAQQDILVACRESFRVLTLRTCFTVQPAGRATYCQGKACYSGIIFQKISPYKLLGRPVSHNLLRYEMLGYVRLRDFPLYLRTFALKS